MVVDPASVESERVKQDYREHNAKVIKVNVLNTYTGLYYAFMSRVQTLK